MDVNHTPTALLTLRRDAHRYDRVYGFRLLLARALWVTIAVFTLVIFVWSLPIYLTQLHTSCSGISCSYQQLTGGQVYTLRGLGWSLDQYAALQVTLNLLCIAVSLGIAALIVWKRSDDRMAMLVGLALVAFGPNMATTSVMEDTSSRWQALNLGLFLFGFFLYMLVYILFPSGRFEPRWMRWIFVVLFGVVVLSTVFLPLTDIIPHVAVTNVGWLLALCLMALASLAQMYRYRRVSTPLERQQTKWVVVGYAVPILGNVLVFPLSLVPRFTGPASLLPVAAIEMSFLLVLIPPLAFGVAVLRYQLWEIDAIINKALVYGMLTGILGALYCGLVLGLGQLVGRLTGQTTQPIVLVISTLAIAGLFLPLRRRLQEVIDRRLYRTKYDAEKTLATFSDTLQQQVDLGHLQAQVLTVVNETMQPTQVWLWLRQPTDLVSHLDKASSGPPGRV